LPTRVFHWTLALSFAGAFLTGDSERQRNLHVLLGYTVLGLIGFRLVWGLVGSRYVRFSALLSCSSSVVRYLGQLVKGRTWRPVGHNPPNALAILFLLLLGIASGVSGWAVYEEIGGDWLEELHEYTSNAMLALVFVHIAWVLVASYLQKDNLVLAMMTGKKRGQDLQAISSPYRLVALLLLTALIGAWIWAWPVSR